MWICPTCGEPHEDQFAECWKCAGAALEGQFSTVPLPPVATERRVRPVSAILSRGVAAFFVGTFIAFVLANANQAALLRQVGVEASFAGAAVFSLICGAVLGLIVGLFVWVVFPYEPTPARPTDREASSHDSH